MAGPEPRQRPPESAFDRQVRENCEAVAGAADAYYQEHGEYPWDESELLPFFPEGRRLMNPDTEEYTEPLSPRYWGLALDPPFRGSTGYRVIAAYDGGGQMETLGYFIVGRGDTCDMVITNAPEAELIEARDEAVMATCRLVEAAVEAFAADNNGSYFLYPESSDDLNFAGNNLQYYLPGGELLANPYTGVRSEPQWDSGIEPGQIVYMPNTSEGRYLISGVGWKRGGVIFRIGGYTVLERALVLCDGYRFPGFNNLDERNHHGAEPEGL